MHNKILMWAGVVVASAVSLMIGLSENGHAATAPTSSASTDYTGPFTTAQHVPKVCLTSVTQTRYYNANAPTGTVELRTGGHGHGGYLKCIYIYLDGPAMYPGDHPYGKWLVFPGLGLPIPQPNGLIVNYQDCFQRGTTTGLPYQFPDSATPNAPNDCGESYLLSDGGIWPYQDGPEVGQPMYPKETP